MKTILLGLIRLYQLTLSTVMGQSCRFYPTCSVYTAAAIKRHGALKGAVLGAHRICRCHPWGGQGVDEVPEIYPFSLNKVFPHKKGAGVLGSKLK
jgi:uncharacterized protein